MLDLIKSKPFKKGKEKDLEGAMGYFSSSMERMNYGLFPACGIFVGSEVIEAGCKVIVVNRMKNAGMHWLKDHAEKMISLRCAIRNGEYLDSYLHDHTLSGKQGKTLVNYGKPLVIWGNSLVTYVPQSDDD